MGSYIQTDRWYIATEICCGSQVCTTMSRYNGSTIISIDIDEHDDLPDKNTEKEQSKAEWKIWYKRVQESLMRLVKSGKMTEEEAREIWDKWIADNPDPDPESDPIEVTQEFQELLHKRVLQPVERR